MKTTAKNGVDRWRSVYRSHPAAWPMLNVIRSMPEPFTAMDVSTALKEEHPAMDAVSASSAAVMIYGWRNAGFLVRSEKRKYRSNGYGYSRAPGFEALFQEARIKQNMRFKPLPPEKMSPVERAWRLFRAEMEMASA